MHKYILYIYIYIYIYIYLCMCVCVCVCVRITFNMIKKCRTAYNIPHGSLNKLTFDQ